MKCIKRKREPYDKFKGLLFAKNTNQKELADKLCKSYSCVNNILNGRRGQFSYEDLELIKNLFKIKINDYF
jgi:transcriptional regulator with XRE-family HTH domain